MLSLQKYACLAKILLLMAVVTFLAAPTQAQNYAPLFTNGTFNKTINVNLPVGATAGEAGVLPVGGATYTIPIVAPPGTNGVIPAVALTYNSMGGNGTMGMGWSISGLSMISRVPRSIYQDGSAGSVELNADDRFALDGMRLVATSGSYGADGTVYATENETFARITSYNTSGVAGTGWFKVEGKDGTVMEYGTTADSRRNVDSQSPTLFWLLKRIKYPDGNYIELNYISPLAPMISEINYTGNSNTGQTPYNRIKFEYTGRNDNNVAYEAGVSVYGDFLLDKVIVTADNQTTRTYQLNYGFDNINSYLREITEKGSDGSSLNSTIFKYGEIPQNFESYPVIYLQESITTSSGDFDGDGYTDIIEMLVGYSDGIAYNQGFKIHKRTANNTNYVLAHQKTFPTTFQIVGRTNVPNFYNFLANDFTGDGTDDVAVANMVINSTTRTFTSLKIYSGETGFASEIDIPTYPNYTKVHASGNYILPGDFNGDGVQDILTMLAFGSSDAYASHLYYGKISNSFGTVAITGTHNLGMNTWPRANRTLVLDFNGDGKSDLMVISNYECEIFTFDGYVAKRIYQGDFPTKDHLIYLGDFNGDRKTDLLVRASLTNNNVAWQQATSTGKVFFRGGLSFQKQPDVVGVYPTDHLTIADFNGDGKTDIYHGWTPNGSYSVLDIYYSRGLSFQHVSHNSDVVLGVGDAQPCDLNGDGRADLVNRAFFPDLFHSLTFRPNGKEHLLEKVANGHGHTTEWSYKRLNEEGAFYSRGNLNNNPFNNIQLPMYAVSELKAQNGIGGVSTVQYAYEEAKIHKRGKGFMGFKKTTAANLTMGVRTVTEMQFNNYPLAAALYQTSSYLIANGQLLNQNTFNNEFVAYGSQFGADKRYWQRVNNSTQNNAFEGRTVSSTYNYDSDGNVTQSTTNNNNVETTTTTTAYGAFATPVPALPTSVTVTKTRSGQPSYSISSTFGYNGIGQLTSKTEFAGLPKSVTTTYGYNNLGNLTNTTVNPSGMASRSSSMAYDDKGRYATSITNVLGQTATANYDPRWGKATSTTGIDGLTTTYEYDAFGRTRKTNLPRGYSIEQTYGWDFANGAVYFTYLQHPGKPDAKTWYDVLGRELRSETEGYQGQWTMQTKTYNARGNVASSTQPYKNGENILTTTTQYDEYNRPTNTGNAAFGNTSMAYAYNGGNLTTTVNNPAGQTTSKTTDASGQTISSTDHGGTLQYTYNSQGNLLTTTKDGSTLSSSNYDAYARQTSLNDPNAGNLTYDYDALGQLTTQTNAAGQATTVQYDVAGRTTTRQAPEGTTTYEYFGNGNGAATGQLRKTTGFAGNLIEYSYDNQGRLSQQKETIDGTDYTSSYQYNAYDDLIAKNYPSGFGTRHEYDANGYPTTIRNHDNNVTLYTNNGMSPLGGNTAYTLGNGRSSSVEHYYGMPTRYTTNGLQDLQLTWNYQTGNLNQRKDHRAGREENFQYDNLNRLTSAQVAGQAAVVVQYDNGGQRTGNINNKTDMGSYAYASNRPNALTGISNPQNAVPNVAQTIAYTPFSQPSTLTENGYELGYTYDADHQRMRGILKQNGNETNRRYYLGDYEKDISNGITRHLHYVSSPAGLIAIVVRENGNDTYYYTYTDHLGSILTLTNSSGNVVAEQSFDAWGRRRDPNSWTPLPPTAPTNLPTWLYRGYTGHEHLDQFGLINMNGRLYDPALGRMLSVDNYVVGAAPSQAHNRYTYAFNNPLLYNDPDGEHPIFIAMAVGAIISAGSYTVGVMMSPGGFHDNWSWKSFGLSALQGAIGGAVSYGIGGAFPIAGKGVEGAISNMLAHGVAGAGQAALFGGNAGQGFVTGFASAGFSIGAGAAGLGAIGQLAAGGLSGGVSNSLAGGNFWEGFGRGLIVSGLNHVLHQGFEKVDSEINVLLDTEGASGHGHMAMLAGNDKKGWKFVSKDGRATDNSSDGQDGNIIKGGKSAQTYTTHKSKAQALSSYSHYDRFLSYKTTYSRAMKAINAAYTSSLSNYHVLSSNCGHTVADGLRAVGYYSGYAPRPAMRYEQLLICNFIFTE